MLRHARPDYAFFSRAGLGETIEAAPQELRGFLLGMASAAGHMSTR